MSTSEQPARHPFQVRVELDGQVDRLSRIHVTDGRERPLAEEDGSLWLELPPGLYSVRVERGGQITDLVLRHSAEAPVDRVIPAPQRSTALPTTDSSTGTDYYRDAARLHSTADTGSCPLPVSAADNDPRLFIFVRAASRQAYAGAWVGNGLELCDRHGAILSLFGEEHTEADAADGWLAFSRRLPAGFYRLRWVDPSGSRAIALTLFDDWDTQVFVPFDGRPMVEHASILLPQRGEPFDPDSPDAQSTDMGLLGLRSGWNLVSGTVQTELLSGKFRDPMLGLIGAHLLLMVPAPRRDRVDTVLGNLRHNLLGDVADVRALEWRAWQRLGGPRPPQQPFDVPPMLRAGLLAVVSADAESGGLISVDGVLSWISRYQRADSAWTTWSPPVRTHTRPLPERTARPYFVPEKRDVIFLDTEEDINLSGKPDHERRDALSRNAAIELAVDALRDKQVWATFSEVLADQSVERPVNALHHNLDTLDLNRLVPNIFTQPVASNSTSSGLGPSLSVALPHEQAAEPMAIGRSTTYRVRPGDTMVTIAARHSTTRTELERLNPQIGNSELIHLDELIRVPIVEDSSHAWIDNLVKEVLATARRTNRDLDVAALARAANLPRAIIEQSLAHMTDPGNALTASEYLELYRQSLNNLEEFWSAQASNFLDWFGKWDTVLDYSYDVSDVYVNWFKNGKLNATYNCLDRHLGTRGDQTAIIWEGDNPKECKHLTYRGLHTDVCKLGNVLKSRGVKKGARVCIYMPMIPEAVVAMLACARIGAVHSIVFGGFSPDSLRDRIQDSECRLIITADESVRGGRNAPLKKNADQALAECPSIDTCIVVKRTGGDVDWSDGRDIWYHEALAAVDAQCEPEPMDAEDPLFILYTSGSTGKPKGVLHTTGGYLVFAAMTHKYTFDYQDGEVYWCTADVGWVTGHTYIVYGPLANGATSLMFEGVPNYPDMSRFWEVIDKHNVAIFYTAPTAIRSLMRAGEEPVKKTSRKSLRILGSVGEPINPEAWEWYHRVVGDGRCPIVDTWWQTESGGHMITQPPRLFPTKPGASGRPFFGVVPGICDKDTGEILEGNCDGALVIAAPWPAQARTIWGNHQRFVDTYFKPYPGYYFTGDAARRDAEGDYWITGRIDDLINVSGHRIDTSEIESALVLHPHVAEAAVVGYPHDIKGQGVYAYVTLMASVEATENLKKELVAWVRGEIGPFATLDVIQWTPGLPKTRSGKTMHQLLRKIAAMEPPSEHDMSTAANQLAVSVLREGRREVGK